jgi:hypothetical protein
VRYFRERAAVGDRESFHSPKTPPCNWLPQTAKSTPPWQNIVTIH